MSRLEYKKLKYLTTKIGSGATPTGGQSAYKLNGISLIRSQNVLDISFSSDGLAFIDELQAKKLDNVEVKENDILLNITGDSIARVCKVPKEILPARVNQHVSILRSNGDIDPNYLLYYLINKKKYLLTISRVGGTRNALTKEAIENLDIKIDINQQKIASVLSALDDKIELNNRINAELEAMAKTLYDYWFVQFDFPTHSHCEERGTRDEAIHNKKIASLHEVTLAKTGYKSSGGKMVYNETLKREIPEGWEVKSLYEIADYINGLACQKFRPENENDDYLPVIKIREMNEGKSNNTERARINIPEKNIINDGDVLFAWSASLDVKIWTEGKGALNQHIFKVVSKDFPRSFYYFELLNYLKHFKMMAELRKTTMGHITIDHLKTSYISIPPKNLIEKLDKKLNILIEKIIINQKQNQELSALRDWLLPMLMNGQVKVK